jgi:DNA-directed RNA polymerase subunit M/transcription elongation factor TFIIS
MSNISRRAVAVQLIGKDLEQKAWQYAQQHNGYPLLVRRLYSGMDWQTATQVWQSEEPTLEVHDGVNRCGKCGSHKVLDQSMQTRSADEAMTHFFYCTICKNHWKT